METCKFKNQDDTYFVIFRYRNKEDITDMTFYVDLLPIQYAEIHAFGKRQEVEALHERFKHLVKIPEAKLNFFYP